MDIIGIYQEYPKPKQYPKQSKYINDKKFKAFVELDYPKKTI